MPAPNHRELIAAADKKSRSEFLRLPHDLQDEVIDGLDAGELTLKGASDLIKSRNYSLSHEAVANYYASIKRERKLFLLRTEMARIVTEYSGYDTQKNVQAALNMILLTLVQGLSDGEIGVKDIDLSRMMANLSTAQAGDAENGGDAVIKNVTPGALREKVEQAKKEFYGI